VTAPVFDPSWDAVRANELRALKREARSKEERDRYEDELGLVNYEASLLRLNAVRAIIRAHEEARQ
jgi:hypothetical protein